MIIPLQKIHNLEKKSATTKTPVEDMQTKISVIN